MEKIFLSHHFDNQIEPVVEAFKRLIESHDLNVLDGRRLQGQFVAEEVTNRIKESDAVIVFLTKREANKSHDWVNHERSTAIALGKPYIAIIEQGVVNPAPFQGREIIEYDPNDMPEILLAISENLFAWKLKLGEMVEANLEPDDVVTLVRDNANQTDVVQYRFLRDGRLGDWHNALVVRRAGGISLIMNGVTKDSEIQIRVSANNRIWESDVIDRNLRILVS